MLDKKDLIKAQTLMYKAVGDYAFWCASCWGAGSAVKGAFALLLADMCRRRGVSHIFVKNYRAYQSALYGSAAVTVRGVFPVWEYADIDCLVSAIVCAYHKEEI